MRKSAQIKQDMLYAKLRKEGMNEANKRWRMKNVIKFRKSMGIPEDTSILELSDEDFLKVARKIWEKEQS